MAVIRMSKKLNTFPVVQRGERMIRYVDGMYEHLDPHPTWFFFHREFSMYASCAIQDALVSKKQLVLNFDFVRNFRNAAKQRLVTELPVVKVIKRLSRIVWDAEDERQVEQARQKYVELQNSGGVPLTRILGKYRYAQSFNPSDEEVMFKMPPVTEVSPVNHYNRFLEARKTFTVGELWQAAKVFQKIVDDYPKYQETAEQ